MRTCCVGTIRNFSSIAHEGNVVLCGPAVRFLLQQYNINQKDVQGSGPKKNILKSDVLSLIHAKKLKPVTFSAEPPKAPVTSAPTKPTSTQVVGSRRSTEKFVDIPLTNIRSTIAKRLSTSKRTIPHEYQSTIIRSDSLISLRRSLKEDGVTLSVNDFIVKAVGLALKSVPGMNVQYKDDNVVRLAKIDVSVAVATPTGLITPIVTNADCIGVREISHKIKELAGRAKENQLQPHEFMGGSFTVSNLGMFGSVDNFTAIINPPQAAILAVGGNVIGLNAVMKPENRFTATLCYDGRAISETTAAEFLAHFNASLSDPQLMILEPMDQNLDFDFSRLL